MPRCIDPNSISHRGLYSWLVGCRVYLVVAQRSNEATTLAFELYFNQAGLPMAGQMRMQLAPPLRYRYIDDPIALCQRLLHLMAYLEVQIEWLHKLPHRQFASANRGFSSEVQGMA